MLQKIIKSISPDPVASAVVEIRFSSAAPPVAVYGMMYNAFGQMYVDPKSLPVMQLPEEIRLRDPNFKFKPWHQLSGDNLTLQMGPDVLAINCDCDNGYMGWQKFSGHVSEIVESVKKTDVMNQIHRIGIRYISFFEGINIFDKLRLGIDFEGKSLTDEPSSFVTSIKKEDFVNRLSLNNDATKNSSGEQKTGSLIDVDTYHLANYENLDNVISLIATGHRLEKEIFFSLLSKEFLETLNPTYE